MLGLTSSLRMGDASAFSSGGVTKPNHSRSFGGGGTQAHTVPWRECISTRTRKCILRSQMASALYTGDTSAPRHVMMHQVSQKIREEYSRQEAGTL